MQVQDMIENCLARVNQAIMNFQLVASINGMGAEKVIFMVLRQILPERSKSQEHVVVINKR